MQKSKSDAIKLINKHKNQDIVVVGCGPSLDEFDLSTMGNYVSIGTNYSYRKVKTNYLVVWDVWDVDFLELVKREICFDAQILTPHSGVFLWHGRFNKFSFGNSGIKAVKIASHMGAKRIITVGIDFNVTDQKTHFKNYDKNPLIDMEHCKRFITRELLVINHYIKKWKLNVFKCSSFSLLDCPVIDFFPRIQ